MSLSASSAATADHRSIVASGSACLNARSQVGASLPAWRMIFKGPAEGSCATLRAADRCRFEVDEIRAFRDLLAGPVVDRGDLSGGRGRDRVLHLHRLEDHQRRAAVDALALLDEYCDYRARPRRPQ